jgi:pyruvate dehydrogenase E2 component (dihydrolipoamide acetyltransferase)
VGTITEVFLPDLGDFKDVDVIEVLVKPGDHIAQDESIITLESEKATMEIPSPYDGEVKELKVAVGDKISQGALVMIMDVQEASEVAEEVAPNEAGATMAEPEQPTPPAAAPTPAPAPAAEPAPRAYGEKEPQPRPVIAKPSDAPKGKAHASPAVRRFARELGVELMSVPGSGSKGRITKEDVQNFVKQALSSGGGAAAPAAGTPFNLPAAPEVDFSKFGETETQPLGRIKKLSGAHLHRSWLTVPHVTQFDEADITELEAFRKSLKDTAAKQELKLTFMPFLLKAVAAALTEFPQFNSSLAPDGESLILKKYVNIGVAVDTPNGLVVPVVRDVDQKGVFQLAADLMELSGKARAGKLAPGDMQGGCISISSLGGIGGTQFTPIVNMPEVAILGISRAEMKPKWNGTEFLPRLMMPFSLSYDHRVIDGAEGVRFTTYLNGLLSDIRKLVL